MKKIIFSILSVLLLNSCVMYDARGQLKVIDQAEESFDNIAKLVVKGSFCEVDIKSHSLSVLDFKAEVKSRKDRDDIRISYEVEGSTLNVWIERPRSLSGSFDGFLHFLVPKNTHVFVENSSGSIRVENIGQSMVELSASSGSIRAENIDSDLSAIASSGSLTIASIDGDLTAKTSSGSQSISHIEGNVNTSLSSGSINISDVKGEVKTQTSSGSQKIYNVENGVEAVAVSGSINMENIIGHVNAKTSSGSIKLKNIKGVLHLSSSSGGQSGIAVLLTGDSSFSSSSGSVQMELLNSEDQLSFDLRASSGSLRAMGTSGDKHLMLDRGTIRVTGNSSSGSQVYR